MSATPQRHEFDSHCFQQHIFRFFTSLTGLIAHKLRSDAINVRVPQFENTRIIGCLKKVGPGYLLNGQT
jgi:hypothetical protein